MEGHRAGLTARTVLELAALASRAAVGPPGAAARTDEAEDGGRAIAIEEGISALVFSYAARHGYFETIHRVDQELLTTIASMVSHLEVSIRRAADWENAITTGYQAWRQLHAAGGGTVELDIHTRTLSVT